MLRSDIDRRPAVLSFAEDVWRWRKAFISEGGDYSFILKHLSSLPYPPPHLHTSLSKHSAVVAFWRIIDPFFFFYLLVVSGLYIRIWGYWTMCASIFFLFNVKRFVIPHGKLKTWGFMAPEGDDWWDERNNASTSASRLCNHLLCFCFVVHNQDD